MVEDETLSLLIAAFASLVVTSTLIALATPVDVERSTRCAPSAPLTMVADTPGLSDAELIAETMPETAGLRSEPLTARTLPIASSLACQLCEPATMVDTACGGMPMECMYLSRM